MEEISYTAGIIWLLSWPILVFISYKFIALNVSHLHENIDK